MNGQMDGQMNKWTGGQMDGLTVSQMNRPTVGWTGGWLAEWMDQLGWMNG